MTSPLRQEITAIFEKVFLEQTENTDLPKLTDETALLDAGLDSLGFAVLVTALEEELGYDPFSIAEDPFYPETFGEFVAFYETHKPENAA